MISSKGKYPEIGENKRHLFSFGPITRYSSDLRLAIYSMAGKESIEKKLPRLFEKADFKNLKIYYMLDDGDPFKTRTIPEIRSSIRKSAVHFESTYGNFYLLSSNLIKNNIYLFWFSKIGTMVKEVHFDKFKNSLNMWSSLLAELSDRSFTSYMADFPEDGSEVNPYKEFLLSLIKKSDHTITSIVYAIFDKMKDKNSPKVKMYIEMIDEVKKELNDLLRDDAVFFYPTYPSYAEKHGTTILKAHNCGYPALFNILSFPATQCPIKLDEKSNMPIGFQVVATPFNDHLTLSVAEELEKVFGGWRSPCRIET